MKLTMTQITLICFSFLSAVYMPPFLASFLVMSDSKIEKFSYDRINKCSENKVNCAYFRMFDYNPCNAFPTLCDYHFIGKLLIYNQINHEYAKIDINMGIEDHNLSPSRIEWTTNNQFDVYLENNNSSNTDNYFFKRLGDIKVIVHGRK